MILILINIKADASFLFAGISAIEIIQGIQY